MVRRIEEGASGRGAAGGDVRFEDVPEELVEACAARLAIELAETTEATPLLRVLQRSITRRQLAMPVFSATLTRILRLLEDDDVGVSQIATAVEADPGLATKIVGVANSGFYGGIEAVGSVQDALMRTGLEQAKNIVAGVAIRSSVFRAPGYEGVADMIWKRSISTALACLALLESEPRWRDSAFLLGLVHDVGRIILLASAAVPLAERGRVFPAPVIERAGSAIRCELGAIALAAWAFDDEMIDAVAWQERPESCPEASRPLCAGLYAADTVVNLGFRGWVPGRDASVDECVLELVEPLGFDLQQCAELLLIVESGMSAFSK